MFTFCKITSIEDVYFAINKPSVSISELPLSVWRVLKSPLYACILCTVLTYMFAVMAFASFGPKYIENQFQIATWKANIVMGTDGYFTLRDP